jgi:hypothetical protein
VVASTLVCKAGAATSPLRQMQPLSTRLAGVAAHIFHLDDNRTQGGSPRCFVDVAQSGGGVAVGGRRLKLMSTSADSDAQHPSSACTLLSLVRTGLCITGRWQGGGRAAAGAALMSRVGFSANFLNILRVLPLREPVLRYRVECEVMS